MNGTGTGGIRNNRTSGDHPNYSIVEIGQNTKKSPGDLRRLVVTQTLVKDRQLTLMWKILKVQNNKKKKETESLLIAAQDNAIRTNYVNARIDQTQQNIYWLYGDKDEIINYIIGKCSKFGQK